mgnify:CR=1 FL=1
MIALTLGFHVRLLSLLELVQLLLAAHKPLTIAIQIGFRYALINAFYVGLVLSLVELLLVLVHVALVHLTHFLDFIQVYNEAALVRVVLLDALAAKHRIMIGTIEVLHALFMPLAEQALDAILVFEV